MTTVTRLRGELLKSIAAYENAKCRFAAITAAYTSIPGIDPTTAETRASSDYRRRKAGEDCSWHGAEIERYAAAIAALTLSAPTTDDMALARAVGVTPTHMEATRA